MHIRQRGKCETKSRKRSLSVALSCGAQMCEIRIKFNSKAHQQYVALEGRQLESVAQLVERHSFGNPVHNLKGILLRCICSPGSVRHVVTLTVGTACLLRTEGS